MPPNCRLRLTWPPPLVSWPQPRPFRIVMSPGGTIYLTDTYIVSHHPRFGDPATKVEAPTLAARASDRLDGSPALAYGHPAPSLHITRQRFGANGGPADHGAYGRVRNKHFRGLGRPNGYRER